MYVQYRTKKHFLVRLAQNFLEAQTFDLPVQPLLPNTRYYAVVLLFLLLIVTHTIIAKPEIVESVRIT